MAGEGKGAPKAGRNQRKRTRGKTRHSHLLARRRGHVIEPIRGLCHVGCRGKDAVRVTVHVDELRFWKERQQQLDLRRGRGGVREKGGRDADCD